MDELQHANVNCEEPSAIRMALFFHDAVYEPLRKDNEEMSAKMAYDILLKDTEIYHQYPQMVSDLIMATKPGAVAKTVDEKIIQDIDLSILGANKSNFRKYEKQIRAEYEIIPINIYKEARTDILEGFLEKDFIYNTDFFRNKYEATARENLKNSIAKFHE